FSAVVRVRDDTAPSVWSVDGGLAGDAWLSGSQFIGYGSSDNVGIRATRLYVDGAQRDDLQRDCDFTQRVPCSNLPYARYGVDTQALADGSHEVRVESVDTAANAGSFTRTIRVDNHAPDAPEAVAVDGGEGWRQTNSFQLAWAQPPSAAPVTVAHYELCDTSTGACTTGERRGDGIAAIPDLAVPQPGDYTVRVWLEDAAGNVSSANKSLPVHVRFDNVPPGQASPRARAGWVGAQEARSFDQAIDMAGEFVPRSGVAGYSVTTDGSDPDAVLDVVGDTYHAGALPEGTTTFKARAISGSGVPSDKVGTTLIRVDSTPPVAGAVGAPDGSWQPGPARFHITGTDQPGLSGMLASPLEQPLESGAYVSHRVDAGEIQRARGGDGEVVVSADGEHVVTYSATDAAGNQSPESTARIRIDSTPPELVVFEAPSSEDPRRVEVAASDRTSGIASARVEIRRLGSSARGLRAASGDGWTELKAVGDGGHFTATIDDESITQGVYQLRARVFDRAGNEAVGDRRRDGSVASFDSATLRAQTKLAAGLITPAAKAKPRCSRPRGGKKRCKRSTTTTAGGGLVTTLVAPFGTAVTARGGLATAGGLPIAGAPIDVYSRSASAGSPLKLVDHVRTDPAGNFSYGVKPGEGRTLRFHYPGSAHERAAQADVTLKVPAASTIRASRPAVRNGQRVAFTGALRTKPIPRSGKVIDLQAFYRGRWRTFATPRAAAGGAWRYVYRFGATRGRVTYRFRVVVRPESAYPFELGISPEARVRVGP
ncbi:MAG: large repetitive protein, partial [Solirubrobacteraceae bacterium]|nr:large repetitive protein [Solirubrobacteraceae bacterium]